MRAALRPACVAALLLAACGERAPAPAAASAPYPLSDVVAARLAELDAAIDDAPPPPLASELEEEVDGLVVMLVGADARLRSVPLDAVREEIGPAAIPRLAEALADGARPPEERVAAAELLAALDHPAAAEALAGQVEASREAWVRQWCAWHLRSTSQDQVVPRLVLRLKYEQDHGAFLWLAVTLARFRCYAGLDALVDLTRMANSAELRAQAAEQLAAIAGEVGLEVEELRRRWAAAEADSLPQPEPSARLRRAVWRRVADLGQATFQLRPVDDARHTLAHMGPWVATEIAPALADTDEFVRLHVSEVLARMGPRAAAAGPALVAALDEPRVAPWAAEALAGLGDSAYVPPLLGCAAPGRPHELRVAAVRALGRLPAEEGHALLRARFGDGGEPYDLRMAAAAGLVRLEAPREAGAVVRWLVAELGAPDGDADAAELALEEWLARGWGQSIPGFEEAREAWRAQAGAQAIPTLEDARARHARRAAELAGRLDGLLD